MGNAVQAMIILRKRTNYTETEILQFQEYYDLFAQDWIVLWGQAGMTNYIHMAISGHISDNMTHFKCMYRFSQQGWENINSLLKTFFFKRTNHGGSKNKNKLESIARWIQRRMIFMCGFSKEEIQNVIVKIKKSELINELHVHS